MRRRRLPANPPLTAVPGGPPQPAPPPAEESPLLTEPTTPVELFDAAVLCDRLYRPRARQAVLGQVPEVESVGRMSCSKLRDKYGPALFLRFAHNPDLQPAGAQVADLTTAATRRRSEDTTYLDSLIRNLGGPPEDRDTAQEMLDNIGPTVIPRMLQHVAAPQGTESAEVLVQSIVRMGQKTVPVLLGALESTNDSVRIAAMQALGYLARRQPFRTCSPRRLTIMSLPAFATRPAWHCLASSACRLEKGDGPPSFGAAAELRRIRSQRSGQSHSVAHDRRLDRPVDLERRKPRASSIIVCRRPSRRLTQRCGSPARRWPSLRRIPKRRPLWWLPILPGERRRKESEARCRARTIRP